MFSDFCRNGRWDNSRHWSGECGARVCTLHHAAGVIPFLPSLHSLQPANPTSCASVRALRACFCRMMGAVGLMELSGWGGMRLSRVLLDLLRCCSRCLSMHRVLSRFSTTSRHRADSVQQPALPTAFLLLSQGFCSIDGPNSVTNYPRRSWHW